MTTSQPQELNCPSIYIYKKPSVYDDQDDEMTSHHEMHRAPLGPSPVAHRLQLQRGGQWAGGEQQQVGGWGCEEPWASSRSIGAES